MADAASNILNERREQGGQPTVSSNSGGSSSSVSSEIVAASADRSGVGAKRGAVERSTSAAAATTSAAATIVDGGQRTSSASAAPATDDERGALIVRSASAASERAESSATVSSASEPPQPPAPPMLPPSTSTLPQQVAVVFATDGRTRTTSRELSSTALDGTGSFSTAVGLRAGSKLSVSSTGCGSGGLRRVVVDVPGQVGVSRASSCLQHRFFVAVVDGRLGTAGSSSAPEAQKIRQRDVVRRQRRHRPASRSPIARVHAPDNLDSDVDDTAAAARHRVDESTKFVGQRERRDTANEQQHDAECHHGRRRQRRRRQRT